MTSNTKQQLWTSGAGIRFAPAVKQKQPVSPRPATKRFIPKAISRNEPGKDDFSGAQRHSEPPSAREIPSDGPEDQSFVIDLPLREAKPMPKPSDSPQAQVTMLPKGSDLKHLPPSTSLEYQISADRFHHARKSPQGSPASYWSYNMYSKGDPETGIKKGVKVHYCKSKHTMEEVCKRYFLGSDVLGLDLEWKINAKATGPVRDLVSLIQIANEGHVGLFHVAIFPDKKDGEDPFIGPIFRRMMEDCGVSKAGVNIKADCSRLRKYLGVDVMGIFELSHLYKLVKYSKERKPRMIDKKVASMAIQVEEYLRLPLYKGDSVRTSNWTLPLNPQQIAYSASDAYAGFQLYHVLEQHRLDLDPCPPRPYHAELGKPLEHLIPKDEEVVPLSEDSASKFENLIDETITDDDLLSLESSLETTILEPPSTPKAPKTPISALRDRGSPGSPSSPNEFWDERVNSAHKKMEVHRARRSNNQGIAAQPTAIRAYYVWHDNDDLDPAAVAKLLRSTPLQTNTVIWYILEAVALENFPYDRRRMADEVLDQVPKGPAINAPKYQTILQTCSTTAPQEARGRDASERA